MICGKKIESKQFTQFYLFRYLEGVGARVWVDDVVAQFDIPPSQLHTLLAVDPWIHLMAQTDVDNTAVNDTMDETRKVAKGDTAVKPVEEEEDFDGKHPDDALTISAALVEELMSAASRAEAVETGPRVAMSLARMVRVGRVCGCL